MSSSSEYFKIDKELNDINEQKKQLEKEILERKIKINFLQHESQNLTNKLTKIDLFVMKKDDVQKLCNKNYDLKPYSKIQIYRTGGERFFTIYVKYIKDDIQHECNLRRIEDTSPPCFIHDQICLSNGTRKAYKYYNYGEMREYDGNELGLILLKKYVNEEEDILELLKRNNCPWI